MDRCEAEEEAKKILEFMKLATPKMLLSFNQVSAVRFIIGEYFKMREQEGKRYDEI